MNIKKVVFPLVMLLVSPLAFAQNDGPEPDWNNPDEVGNVFVCLDKGKEGIQAQGEWNCRHGVWFTVDMVPDGKGDFSADQTQVEALTRLVDEYQSTYKVASYVKDGKNFAVKNRNIYLYRLPSKELKLATQNTEDVLGSQVFFKTFETKTAAYLVVLPRLEHGFSGQVTLRFNEGKLLGNVVFRSAPEDDKAEFILPELVLMEPFKDADEKIRYQWVNRQVTAALQQNNGK